MILATTTVGLTRQACDRCRKLKLRCTRADNAGVCDRCLRKGAQCAYSSSLPKGRRSKHASRTSAGGHPQAGISEDFANGLQDTGSGSSGMDCEGVQFDVAVGESPLTTDSTLDWLYGMNSSLCDDIAAGSAGFPSSQDGGLKQVNDAGNTSSRGSDVMDTSSDSRDDPEVLIAQLAQLSTQISLLRRSGSLLVKGSPPSFPYNTQSDGRSQAHQPPIIDDAVFQSVATWLARGPIDTTPSCSSATSHACYAQAPKIKTLGDLLYHIFSASHHFLELLQHVPGGSASNNVAITGPDVSPSFLDFAIPSLNLDSSTPVVPESSQGSAWTSPCSNPIASSNNGIRHLLIANHTMLLGIYSEVFGLLQRYAGSSASDGTAPLREIRLVSVVQLCSYLIERQHQAMDLYLSSPTGCLMEPENVPDTMTTEAMKAIRTEVGQRIVCLQRMVQM